MRLADVRFEAGEGIVIARLEGEIDMSNADELGGVIAKQTPNEALGLVLDLTYVDYLDSAGIQLVYRLRECVQRRGQGLRLVVPDGSPVADALRLASVEVNVAVVETVEAALQAFLGGEPEPAPDPEPEPARRR
jgi:anti-anti-sigma factor